LVGESEKATGLVLVVAVEVVGGGLSAVEQVG
jgi:hypothetical protein